MNYVVVIPARKGSKRLPGKNIKSFGGKPLIWYSVEAAIRAGLGNRVYISTDSEEIAAAGREFGAQIIDRPEELASDTSSTSEVLEHAAKQLKAAGVDFDAVITLQPTNPIRPKNLLKEAIEAFEAQNGKAESLMSVCENKHKLGKISDDLFVPYSYKLGERSQDIDRLYFENGAVYITTCETVLEKKSVFGDAVFPLLTDSIFGLVDIDTQEDFDFGELILTTYKDKIIV